MTPQQAATLKDKKKGDAKKDQKRAAKEEKKAEKDRQKQRKKLVFEPMFGTPVEKLIQLQKQNSIAGDLPVPFVTCLQYLKFEAVIATQGKA